MVKNMGTLDRSIRTIAAIVLLVLVLSGQITGTWAIILCIVAALWLLTSLVAVCPAYMPFKISTRKTKPTDTPNP